MSAAYTPWLSLGVVLVVFNVSFLDLDNFFGEDCCTFYHVYRMFGKSCCYLLAVLPVYSNFTSPVRKQQHSITLVQNDRTATQLTHVHFHSY
jgi:hypothetical protein